MPHIASFWISFLDESFNFRCMFLPVVSSGSVIA
uniref:Uncharacterized protein n=1 Tax=Arundo donax TaxID=35708 RepID=A0A0A9BZJ8_ARUDO